MPKSWVRYILNFSIRRICYNDLLQDSVYVFGVFHFRGKILLMNFNVKKLSFYYARKYYCEGRGAVFQCYENCISYFTPVIKNRYNVGYFF